MRKLRNRLARTPLRRPLTWWRHRELDDRDVMLASYPRSGNTWLRFLLFQLLEGRPANFGELDAPDSVAGHVERAKVVPRALPGGGRLLKTHERWRPEYPRAIYLLRDVRAVVVSEYKFLRWRGFFSGDMEAFVEAFLAGRVNPYGIWGEHLDTWRDSPVADSGELLLVRYEDLRAEPVEGLARIVQFLGVEFDESRLQEVIDDNSVEKLREREDREPEAFHRGADRRFRFVNKGQTRGWRDSLSESQIARLSELGRRYDDWSGYE